MTKFILSVVAASLSIGVAVAGPGGKGGSGGSHPSPSPSSFHQSNSHWGMSSSYKPSGYQMSSGKSFGKSFSHGIYFPGKSWNHWSYNCYWSKYGCQCYWCPNTCCYYYWCEPACCYYPISYIQYAPPTQVQVQVTAPVTVAAPAPVAGPAIQTQTQTQTQGVGGPPAGIPPLPQ